MLPNSNVAVDAVYRSDWGRIVATLIRQFNDFELAEDAAQEAIWPQAKANEDSVFLNASLSCYRSCAAELSWPPDA